MVIDKRNEDYDVVFKNNAPSGDPNLIWVDISTDPPTPKVYNKGNKSWDKVGTSFDTSTQHDWSADQTFLDDTELRFGDSDYLTIGAEDLGGGQTRVVARQSDDTPDFVYTSDTSIALRDDFYLVWGAFDDTLSRSKLFLARYDSSNGEWYLGETSSNKHIIIPDEDQSGPRRTVLDYQVRVLGDIVDTGGTNTIWDAGNTRIGQDLVDATSIDLSITPTWTGPHTFDGGVTMGTVDIVEDNGPVQYLNMDVSSTPGAGTEESISVAIDATDILTVYAEADGAGGIQNREVHLSLSDGGVNFVGSDGTGDSMTADPETATEDGYVTVSIDGSTYQIPAYSA